MKIYSSTNIADFEIEKNAVVVFDLCGTLYDVNTTFDFFDKYFFKTNNHYQSFRNRSKLLIVKILNRIGLLVLGVDFIRTLAVSYLRGVNRQELDKSSENYITHIHTSRKVEVIHKLLLLARQKGSPILVSASIDSIVRAAGQQLGFNSYFATTLEVINGELNGKIQKDLLGKKGGIIKSFKNQNRKIYIITDNISDSNIIGYVDYFIAVSGQKNMNYWSKKKGVHAIIKI